MIAFDDDRCVAFGDVTPFQTALTMMLPPQCRNFDLDL